MPVSVALILGEEATARYHETGKIPTIDWLQNHPGEVCRRTYPDYKTYKAVREAVEKSIGQQDGLVMILEETPDKTLSFRQQREELVRNIVADLRSIAVFPKHLFPHTVFIATQMDSGEYTFKSYTLVSINIQNATCTLEDPDTLKRTRHQLHTIGLEGLLNIWERCRSMMAEDGAWQNHATAFLQKHSRAALPHIRKFVGEHWQNMLSDADNLAAFRIYIAE